MKKKEKVIKPLKEVKPLVKEEVKIAPVVKQELKPPVTFQEHLDAGWVLPDASEGLQRTGGTVIEIKNFEGKILHKIKE